MLIPSTTNSVELGFSILVLEAINGTETMLQMLLASERDKSHHLDLSATHERNA